ncbi:hypothetical protein CEP54_002883 [Fusarium duplospermum]|uniref:Protein kinase domain-containing protein n=1 Tax=Fusarium duplospermum TaxID=1325734 RepID=A0A428QSX8_9HYPO|nr:hypothetical protein CEP54_002883 [Fusarium duplospermum]
MGHQDWIESLNGRQVSVSRKPPKPVKVELSSFWVKLSDACVKSAIDDTGDQDFLPFSSLLELLSRKNVNKLLREKFPNNIKKFNHQVYEKNGDPKRLKIMGTLLLMGHLEFLLDFVEAEIEDSQLPLGLGRRDRWPILFDRSGKKIESGHKVRWEYNQAELFRLKQMQLCSLFCAVKEDGGYVKHFRLPRGFILPFRACQPPEVLQGGFGQITKVRVDPSHLWYRGKDQNPEYFSVKTIRHASPEHPDEADSLARRLVIRDRADREHLHRLLFSFRRADFYYFVFEWADGDLTKLWQEMPQLYKLDSPEDVCWFFKQCVGIMRSLNALQNHASSFTPGQGLERIIFEECHGRHNDIKPENILWFKNYEGKIDHLVIADLGLTQFNSTKSKSRMPWMDVRGYTQTYKAPESDVKGFVSGKYDVWGMGCVFLLHASVFLLGDAKCPEDFSKLRVKEDREFVARKLC